MSAYVYRELVPADAPFLLEMLRLAVGWSVVAPAAGSAPPAPVPPHVFAELGRPGDGGVVVTYAGEPVGACWYRLLPEGAAGSGYAGDGVPELTIALRPEHRARGVGGTLLHRGIAHAKASGFTAIALSVGADNPARGMYERRGFEVVEAVAGSLTMRRPL